MSPERLLFWLAVGSLAGLLVFVGCGILAAIQ